ncbi:restriction endonuclease subunit S [Enterococcus faecium]|uniref:restriction endonuclease subunit S n=1 Tax=Enterococcus faecium TaxID=1352 RepID=UPI001E62173F|nr:restriction endonuclease subunit S [Enterococcus faecium]MCD4990192.1 restriction endonuclease subunit S [Enterococcus faecium]
MQEERTNVPKIRFKGYAEEWEERKLGDVLTVSKEKNKSNSYSKEQILSVSREVGTVNQIEYQGRSFAGADISGYKIVYPGQLIYTKSPLKGAPYGIFQLVTEEGIVSPLYAVYNSTEQALASFIGLQLKSDNIATHYLSPLVSKGAKNTINITDEGALDGRVTYPTITEQQKIVAFFKQLENTITLHQRGLDLLKQIKQSYLQKMFPKKGEDKPEIRFAGFTEDWEQRKLGDVLTVSKEKNKSNSYSKEQILSVSREVGTVNQIEYQGRSFAGADISGYKIVYPGQLIYTKSPLKGAPYGIFQLVTEEGIVSPLYAVYNSTEQALASFIGLQLKSDNIATHYLSPLVSKGAKNTINITDEGALDGRVTYPTITEQQKIVAFFKQLENTITLHQRELDSLKEMKKSLLQKMFV